MGNDIYNDGKYLQSNPTWHAEDSAWKAQKIAEILKANNINPSSISEIGCGAGEILRHLSSILGRNIQFYGYEISSQAYELCKLNKAENLEFHFKDLLQEEYVEYDVVMAIDVLEHIEDYFGFLRALRSKGSYQIFHIPLDLSVQTVLRGSPIRNVRKSVGHIQYFTKETALATLQDTGYEVLDYSYTDGSLELPNRGWKSNLLNIPRKLFFRMQKDLGVRVLGGSSLLVLSR